MKKVSFRVRNFDKEQFLTFNIDNDAKLDEELFNFIEEEEPKSIVPIIFEEEEEFDTFSYNITDKIRLSELSNQEINAEMVLMVLRSLVLTLIDMTEYRIPFSYLVLHRNYIYVDSDYKIEFICIPLEEMQEEVDLNGFLRNLLASLRFEPSENGDYVAKLFTYINNPALFNLRSMASLIEELMGEMNVEIPEDDSADIYVEYQEVEDGTPEEEPSVASWFGMQNITDDMEPVEEYVDNLDEGPVDLGEGGRITDFEDEMYEPEMDFIGSRLGGFVAEEETTSSISELEDEVASTAEGNDTRKEDIEKPKKIKLTLANWDAEEEEKEDSIEESWEEFTQEAENAESEGSEQENAFVEELEQKDANELVGESGQENGDKSVEKSEWEDESVEGSPQENGDEIVEESEQKDVNELVEDCKQETEYEPVEESEKDGENEPIKDSEQETEMVDRQGLAGEEVVQETEDKPVEEPIKENVSEDKEEGSSQTKDFGIKKPKFKTKETPTPAASVILQDELDEFLAEKELEEKIVHHEDSGLRIKKSIKINRASIVNTQEELKAEEQKAEEQKEAELKLAEENAEAGVPETEANEENVSNSILRQTLSAAGILGGSSASKVNPYLIRVNTGERVMITKQNFKIGKAAMGVDYTIKGNGAISRVHAIITNKDGEYYIKDNKSMNHTYVNGDVVQDESKLLTHESKIVLGDEEFVFKLS